jgi:hypothetical protein
MHPAHATPPVGADRERLQRRRIAGPHGRRDTGIQRVKGRTQRVDAHSWRRIANCVGPAFWSTPSTRGGPQPTWAGTVVGRWPKAPVGWCGPRRSPMAALRPGSSMMGAPKRGRALRITGMPRRWSQHWTTLSGTLRLKRATVRKSGACERRQKSDPTENAWGQRPLRVGNRVRSHGHRPRSVWHGG